MHLRQARELIAAVELAKLGCSSFLIDHLCATVKLGMVRAVIRDNNLQVDRSRLTKNYMSFVGDPNKFVHAMILASIRESLQSDADYKTLLPSERFLRQYKNYVTLTRIMSPTEEEPLLNPNNAWVALDAIDTGVFQKRVCERPECRDVYITYYQSEQTLCHPCFHYSKFLCNHCQQKLPDAFLDKKTGKKNEYCPSCKNEVKRERRKELRRKKKASCLGY